MYKLTSPLDGLRSPFGAQRGGALQRIIALFSDPAATGWVYDNQDLTTMFQDVAGTVPVTAPGQRVRLQLDKSKGLVRPELVANGGFDYGLSGWSTTGTATASVIDGKLSLVSNGAGGGSTTSIATVAGEKYYFSAAYEQVTSRAQIFVGSAPGNSDLLLFSPLSGAGMVGAFFVATGTTTYILLNMRDNTAAAEVRYDNISVRELPGNHRRQPSGDASAPILGRHPAGGRRNLLTNTDAMATQSQTVTAAAHTLSFTGTGTVTLSGASTSGPLIGTGAGNRVSLTFTPTAGSLTLTVSGSVTLAQLELGATATPYQRVTIADDCTEAGVADRWYLRADGADDWMETSAFAWGTDKATVVAGVRRLSNASAGMILETSTNVAVNSGAFWLVSGDATYQYSALSRGSAAISATLDAKITSSSFAPPSTDVVSFASDISGDLTSIRGDGALQATATGDQGTGNFGTYPAYFFRRAGTSAPFNGFEYANIGINRLLTPADLALVEGYVTGVTL